MRLRVVCKVDCSHIIHVGIKQVVEILGLAVVQEVGQEKLVIDAQRVQQPATERVDSVPAGHLLLATSLDLPYLSE